RTRCCSGGRTSWRRRHRPGRRRVATGRRAGGSAHRRKDRGAVWWRRRARWGRRGRGAARRGRRNKAIRGAWSGAGADPTMLVMRTDPGPDPQIRRGRRVPCDRSGVRTASRWGAAAALALAAGVGPAGCSVSRAPLPPGVLAADAAAKATQDLARLDEAQRQSGRAPAELPASLDLPALHPAEPLPAEATVDPAGALEAVRGAAAQRKNGAGEAPADGVDAAAQE